MIRRRLLCTGIAGATAAATAAQGQAPRRVRIAFVAAVPLALESFRRWALPELARGGFVEGRNLEVLTRVAEGDTDRLRTTAAEVLAWRPDVVVASSNPVAHAFLAFPSTTPIVMGFGADDPVAAGFARSLARPGGRVTGLMILGGDLALKRIELAREALPQVRRLGYLAPPVAPARVAAIEAAVRAAGAEPVLVHADAPADFDAAFAALRAGGAEALVLGSSPAIGANAADLAARALQARLPAICEWTVAPGAGCLLTYGWDRAALYRRVGEFVLRVLGGEAPATIPMERADRFRLVVDLKTARALGVEPAPLLLARADEVLD